MTYADVILPLGLEGLFTYAVPQQLVEKTKPFVRVIVPLGKSKTYTGLAVRLHSDAPREGIDIKPIIDVLDEEPVLLPYQYKIWQWMAEYYMCPIGDVFRASFPAGMKQEDGYKPKTETYIRLTPQYQNEQALHIALNMLSRSPMQTKVFTTYLTLSHWDEISEDHSLEAWEALPITREELTNTCHCSAAMISNVIKRGILETYEVPVGRLNTQGQPHPERIKPLSAAQQQAFDSIASPANAKPGTYLLHGVTGSGKTEIYIHLIQKTIDEGKQVLYLLPEIALTVQIMQRLHNVFGDRMGIYHSKYSDAERVEIWQKQLSAQPYDIILGARSAVFLPMTNIGLIIIDEEHESSFKQQDPAPRYHARSVAMMIARHFGAQVVLGTATPSLESFYNAVNGKYHLVQLTERYKGMQLPKIEIVDTADLQRRKMMNGPFSPRLLQAIVEALENDRQVILFQNRRGFAPMIECHQCGWVPKCENCDVSLTMHKVTNQLTCHYCGYTYTLPHQCPCCEGTDLRVRGYGTEKIEEDLELILAERGVESAKISRMDLDTTRTKNAYERIISDFSNGKSNILIGTQMVSKGLDFDRVSVVGIINADSIMNYPDFRSYEMAFQMMAQVSGRAGRKGQQGLVILQTKHPDTPVIDQVVRNDYRAFFDSQCEERQLFRYPPFTRIIYIYLRHTNDGVVDSASIEMGSRLRQLFGSRILGPDRPAVARVKSLNIRKIVVKLEAGIDLPRVRQYLRRVKEEVMQDKRYASLQIYYDVDPQ